MAILNLAFTNYHFKVKEFKRLFSMIIDKWSMFNLK